MISSSWDELLCLQPPNILHYQGAAGSNLFTFSHSVTLSQPLNDPCDGPCWGGTFAFDGAYYYFPFDGNVDDSSISYATYQVYDADGNFVGTFESVDAQATGRLTSLYFDWSAGRYTVHDGYAYYRGGTLLPNDCNQPQGSDTQVYGPPSPYHQ